MPARRPIAVLLMGLALAAGCSSHKLQDEWNKVTGHENSKDSAKNDNRVELNSAGRKRLAKLPGLTGDDADRIVANRPYEQKRDLVRKGVLSEAKFDRIRDEIYVEHGKD